MFKLLVTDVDGTLLDSSSKLPEKNKEALIGCVSKGIKVTFATGKTINGIRGLIDMLGLDTPQITIHGAVIYDGDHKVLRALKIPQNLYREVISSIKEKGYTPLTASTEGTIYYDGDDDKVQIIKEIGESLKKVKSIETDFFSHNSACISISIPETDPLEVYLRQKFSESLQLVRSGKYFFDILHKDSNKGNALKFISKRLGITKKEVIAIGDSPNDVTLFNRSGFAVAVRNAYPVILDLADEIVSSNDECGFAQAVNKYVLV